ncbi:MAG: hypothetical protein KGQ75_05970 [Sphingomonadales bacterium]|nr:hypothetical protein [Sphingomonadales bacterium]
MSLMQRVRDSFARPANAGYQTYTFRIDQQIAYHLVPMIERMAGGHRDAWALVNAIRFHFADDRPIIASHAGIEARVYLEGPHQIFGDDVFPMGAQVAVGAAGWVNLDPIESSDLDRAIRRAIDDAVFRWVSEHNLTGRGSPCRQPRNRELEDHIALRQMAAAAGLSDRESEPSHG